MFEYFQERHKNLNDQLLVSDFSVLATVNIRKIPVQSGEFDGTIGEVLDPLKPREYDGEYPKNLDSKYRVRGLIIEQMGMRLDFFKRITFSAAGKFDPFDMWFLCRHEDVRVSDRKTYFDYAESVDVNGDRYVIRGSFILDVDSSVHVFLNRTQK